MSNNTEERIRNCLVKFLSSSGVGAVHLTSDTDLLKGCGLESDQGLDLVLDLCDEFEFDFPKDFNPLVHSSNKRGRKLRELVTDIGEMLGERASR